MLPLAGGSGLRGAEEVEGVTGQEDDKLVKSEAISQLDVSDAFTLLVLYLSVSWLFVFLMTVLKLETMALIPTVVGVYNVCLLFGFLLNLCGVLFSPSGLWSYLSEFECLFISFRMAQWGTLMTWLRSILSITAPPSVTCVHPFQAASLRETTSQLSDINVSHRRSGCFQAFLVFVHLFSKEF